MTGYPCLDNPRMQQILKHAGVRIRSVAPHRVALECDDGGLDPLTRLILHLEPTAERGNLHMPSLEEAREMGLIRD